MSDKADFLGFGQALAEQRRVGFRVRHGYGATATAPTLGAFVDMVRRPQDYANNPDLRGAQNANPATRSRAFQPTHAPLPVCVPGSHLVYTQHGYFCVPDTHAGVRGVPDGTGGIVDLMRKPKQPLGPDYPHKKFGMRGAGVGIPGDQPTAINELPNYANAAANAVYTYGYKDSRAKAAVLEFQQDFEVALASAFPGGVDGVWGPGTVMAAQKLATVTVPGAYYDIATQPPTPVAPVVPVDTTTAMPTQTKILVAASIFGLGIIGYTMFKGYKPGRRRARA
jgi:hypothetical protein